MGIQMQNIVDKTDKIKYILNAEAFNCNKINIILQIERLFFRGDIHHIIFGKHTILINPKAKLAISDSFPHFFDYMSIVNDLHGLENTFKYKKIEESVFDAYYEKLISNGAEVMSVDVLLWKIFSEMLDKTVTYKDDSLQLKLKYMPNIFALKDNLHPKALEIFSSCLVSPKSMAELSEQFPQVSRIELSNLFILSILSNIGDLETAYKSVDAVNQLHKDETYLSKNDSVKRAKQTGFFKRFMNAIIKEI